MNSNLKVVNVLHIYAYLYNVNSVSDARIDDIDEDGSVTITENSSTKSDVLGEIEFKCCAEIVDDMNSDCVIDVFDLFQIDKTVNNLY